MCVSIFSIFRTAVRLCWSLSCTRGQVSAWLQSRPVGPSLASLAGRQSSKTGHIGWAEILNLGYFGLSPSALNPWFEVFRTKVPLLRKKKRTVQHQLPSIPLDAILRYCLGPSCFKLDKLKTLLQYWWSGRDSAIMIYTMKMSVPPCQKVFFGVASELAVAPLPQACFHAKHPRRGLYTERERERQKKKHSKKQDI